jgi:hypothetical protein
MDDIDIQIDATNADQKREAMRVLSEAQRFISMQSKGFYRLEVSVSRYRPRRTDRQNRYYWPAFVKPFGNYLRAAKPYFTDEMAHEVLKRMFLEHSFCDEHTGQVFSFVRSTTTLNTAEFNEYLDKCAAMLATDCNIHVPPPSVYREREEAEAA